MEGRSPERIKEYRVSIDYLINFMGAEYSIEDITRADVMRFQEYLRKKGLPAPTVNRICRKVRGAFQRLLNNETLDTNQFFSSFFD
jgi:site-specific recombinase XerD